MADGSQTTKPDARLPAAIVQTGDEALLQIWFSPSFPAGSFAYSHGLERAVDMGAVTNAAGLLAWLEDLIRHGGLRNDLVLLAAAFRAATDFGALTELAEFAAAFSPSAERRLETITQGNAAIAALTAAWPRPALVKLATSGADIAYPLALGAAAASHDISLPRTLRAYAVAFAGNLVSAAIRLSVLGQTDGQRTMAALLPDLNAAAIAAEASTLDDLGGAVFVADIASMQHETQYTRLFRS